jgi:alkylation response protein AidB-like acyl-CoA dehydrogenase
MRLPAGMPGQEANFAQLLASEANCAAVDMWIQTFGGFSFAAGNDVERKFRAARFYTVAPISTNLILSYLATKALGLPRSY